MINIIIMNYKESIIKKLIFVCSFTSIFMLLSSCNINIKPNFDTVDTSAITAEKQTDAITTEVKTDAITEEAKISTIMPDQSYIGDYSMENNTIGGIAIYKITDDAVSFSTGVYPYFGISATAVISDSKIMFGDGISSEYSGPGGVTGQLIFDQNGVTIIYNSFGLVSDSLQDGTSYKFTIKSELVSDHIQHYISEHPKTSSATVAVTNLSGKMSDKGYIGVWYTDHYRLDDIMIKEISEDSISFNTGVYRYFGFDATAIKVGDEIVFGDGISPSYSGPDGLTGKIILKDNGITIIYDSFGVLNYNIGKTYEFKVKYKLSN